MYFPEYFLSHFSQYSTLLLFFFAGTIDIPTNSLALGQEMETWHPISPASNANNDGASLRIRAKYQRNLILPLGIYNELLEVNMLFWRNKQKSTKFWPKQEDQHLGQNLVYNGDSPLNYKFLR